MNRNVESHFSYLPSADISRSRFDRSCSIKTSFNVGELVPVYCTEVLPGDTFSIDTSKVVRLQTLITPMMDNMYLDTYWFFVPNRLVWEHWREFMGEATQSAWIDPVEYTPPTVTSPSGGWSTGTIADYMGIPTGIDDLEVDAMKFRGYAKIVDEWFRDENLQTPPTIPINDTDITGSNGTNYITDLVKGGTPFIASKYHDYFTSCLPEPQKGPDVPIPIGSIDVSGTSSVYGTGNGLILSDGTYGTTNNYSVIGLDTNNNLIGGITGPGAITGGTISGGSSVLKNVVLGIPTKEDVEEIGGDPRTSTGLEAVFDDSQVTYNLGTINQLREAFQIQKFYEKLALGGSRYIEIIKSMFGVDSPDARLQRTEYLGGNRVALNINQVVQTSATQSQSGLTTTPMATVSAYSQTNDSHSDFTKSFTEHGHVFCLAVVRYDHTYQQGLARMWKRKNKFDYYWPVFANIGNQPVYNYEIYAQGDSAINPVTNVAYDNEVFGYQEAWADYRYEQNRVTGEMRSNASGSLDVWHLADDYNGLPHLSSSWIPEDLNNVDRVLAVTSANANQVFMDLFIKNIATRPMPVYSVPGLIDHH